MLAFVVGDLTAVDKQLEGLLLAAMKDADIVLHCAGLPEGWQADPRQWDKVTRAGSQTLLNIAGQSSVRQFVMVTKNSPSCKPAVAPDQIICLKISSSMHKYMCVCVCVCVCMCVCVCVCECVCVLV